MKCLSVWQPWATLLVVGDKEFETRSWSSRHRGPLLIHASRKSAGDPDEFMADLHLECGADFPGVQSSPIGFPRGAIVGFGYLTAIVGTQFFAPKISAKEYALGDWTPGRFAWRLAQPKPFAAPIDWRATQGVFDVPDDVVRAAIEACGEAAA